MSEAGEGIWIISTRSPDDEPVCEITWDGRRWYSSVAAVRQTALDLVTCAAYAEMMMKLAGLGLPAQHVSAFTSDLLSGADRTMFGTPETIELLPAGSTKRKEAFVLLRRPATDGWHSSLASGTARDMALTWLSVAEATESDQLVAEALRGVRCSDEFTGRVFGYLRKLRDRQPSAARMRGETAWLNQSATR